MSIELYVYAAIVGLVGLVGLPHLLVVSIKAIAAMRAKRPYHYGFFDGGILRAGQFGSPKRALVGALVGWSLVMGATTFACYARYAGWMNGSCQSILPERSVRTAAHTGVSLAYDESPFQCTVQSKGWASAGAVSLKVAASKETPDERLAAVADRALDTSDATAPSNRSRSSVRLLGEERPEERAARRARPLALGASTWLLDLGGPGGEWAVLHAHRGVMAELHLRKSAFDRPAALTLAKVIEGNDGSMERYAVRGPSAPKDGDGDGVAAWDAAHRESERGERPSPVVGIVGALLLAATLAIIVLIVRRTILARRRAFEALHSTRTPPVASAAR